MSNIISNIVIIIGAIVATGLITTAVWFIMSMHSDKKNKSSESTLTFKDNLINKNYKFIKGYYELYVYLNPTNSQRLIYRIYSHSDWKDVSIIFHDTIRVYFKHMPFEFHDFYVDYILSEYSANTSNSYSIRKFMIDNDLEETNITPLYSNNSIAGYLGIRKLDKQFYIINILQDVGIDRYIQISFDYCHSIRNDKVLNKVIQKVLIK